MFATLEGLLAIGKQAAALNPRRAERAVTTFAMARNA
jgi:hypothetical protein